MDVIDTAQYHIDDRRDRNIILMENEMHSPHQHLPSITNAILKAFIFVTIICIGFATILFPVSVVVHSEANKYVLPIKFVLLTGKSQSGKSEFVNSIKQDTDNTAAVGNGDGISVTTKSTVYSTIFEANPDYNIPHNFKLYLMDTRGFGDIRGNQSDENILEEIVYVLSQIPEAVQLDAIFVTESLSDGTIQLTTERDDGNLDKLIPLFGESVLQNVAVLGTKVLQSETKHGSNIREITVRDLCNEHGIKYMSYESRKGWNYNQQLRRLMSLLFGDSALEAYYLEKVNEVKQEIAQLAQEMMDKTPKKKQSFEYIETYQDGHRCEFDTAPFGIRIRAGCGIPVYKTRPVTKTIEIDHDRNAFMKKAVEEYKKLHKIDVEFNTQSEEECDI